MPAVGVGQDPTSNLAGSTGAFSVETEAVVEAPLFDDTSGNIHSDAIQKIRAAGISLGYNPPANHNFCTDSLVRRDEMATFLSRALAVLSGQRIRTCPDLQSATVAWSDRRIELADGEKRRVPAYEATSRADQIESPNHPAL